MSTPPKNLFIQKSPIARQQWLFLSDYLSDVVFEVGLSGQLMHAHKVIITLASEVFYAQFNGRFSESNPDHGKKPVLVEDIEPEAFTEVLRYIYCEQANVTIDNVIDIYYASKKYMVAGLKDVCEIFLKTTVNEDNVLKVFNENRWFKFVEIDQICLKIVRDNPIKCFMSQDFLTLSQSVMEMIASCRTMNCQEKQLSEAIEKWNEFNGLKIKIKPSLEALQCQKLLFYSSFRYESNIVDTDFKIYVREKLHLYGLGIFVGTNLDLESNSLVKHVQVDVNIEPKIGNVSKLVALTEHCSIEEIMFEKLTVTSECRIRVSVYGYYPSLDLELQYVELFCLNEFKPVGTLGAVELAVTDMNETSRYQGTNRVAYLLYNVAE